MFKLHRYFSITSIIGTLFVAVILVMLYRDFAFAALFEHEARANKAVSQLIVKAIEPAHGKFLSRAVVVAPDSLAQSPEITQLQTEIRKLISGLDIVNIKLHGINGLTIFSASPKEIGTHIERDKHFVSAASGKDASVLGFERDLETFTGQRMEGYVLTTYVPLQLNGAKSLDVIMQLQSNVNGLALGINDSQWKIVLGTSIALAFIYVFLFFIVKYADTMRLDQEERLQKNEEKLQTLKLRDPLTGLINRPMFMDRLKQAMARIPWHKRFIAVVSIDLDHFRRFNEYHGRDAGDALLETVAKRMEKILRGGDTIARDENDRFLLFLNDMANPADISLVAEKMLARIRRPIKISDKTIEATASMGISIYPTDGKDPEFILTKANEALYIAKADGRDKYCLYSITDELMDRKSLRS